jgi:hypothetical protein
MGVFYWNLGEESREREIRAEFKINIGWHGALFSPSSSSSRGDRAGRERDMLSGLNFNPNKTHPM